MSILRPSNDSNARPRALLVAPEVPYPVVGGGALRTASLIEYLAAGYQVDVITFQEAGKPHAAEAFPRGLAGRIDVIELPFHSEKLVARVLRNARRFARGAPPLVDRYSGFSHQLTQIINGRTYDLCLVEHFWCAGYVDVLRAHCSRVVLDLHNIESVLLARYGDAEGRVLGSAFKRLAAACRRLESELLPQFTGLLVCSDADAHQVRCRAPGVAVTVYPNAIPYRELPTRNKSNAIVFSGNMQYRPNLYAAEYFHDRIWPLVRKVWPEVKWQLLGKNPQYLPASIQQDTSVEVVGPVEDAVESLASARVAIAPLLVGSGTRFKIIEAWAAGVPVVSTTVGAEGLPVFPGDNLLVADTPQDFANQVSLLLASDDLCSRLATNARQHFERSLNWAVAWRELKAAGY